MPDRIFGAIKTGHAASDWIVLPEKHYRQFDPSLYQALDINTRLQAILFAKTAAHGRT